MNQQSKDLHQIPCRYAMELEETQGQKEGAPGWLSEGNTVQVTACKACMEEPPPNQVEYNIWLHPPSVGIWSYLGVEWLP